MLSRERIRRALSHQETSQTPLDLSGHRSSGISALSYTRLREYLGLPKRIPRVYDPIQQLAIVDDDVLDFFGVDTIELGRGFALGGEDWREWVLPDGTPCLMPVWAIPERVAGRWVFRSARGREMGVMPGGALYFEQTHFPMAGGGPRPSLADSLDECLWTAVASPPGPLGSGPHGSERLAAGARALRESTSRAIIGLFGGNLLELGQFLYGNGEFLMLLASEPVQAHAFLEEALEFHLANLDRFLMAVGPYLDVILFGDDLGMQTGPQISPAMYREFFQPRHRMLWNRAKEKADVKVMLHCCGGIEELLPSLIEAGLDAINPVQISCRGMDAQALKKKYGSEMVFWGGGCDTQRILPWGSPSEVAAHVKRQVEILRPGGGFVFQQVHNIMAGVPPENIVAMLEAVRS